MTGSNSFVLTYSVSDNDTQCVQVPLVKTFSRAPAKLVNLVSRAGFNNYVSVLYICEPKLLVKAKE